MPTLNDLYYTFIGNKNLNPEYTTQYNIGATYTKTFTHKKLTRLEAQIDGYFNQIDDKIIAMPTSNQFRWTMINLGHVEILGIDAAIQGTCIFNNVVLSPRVSYTYQKAQDFTDRSSQWYGGQIPYIPWHGYSQWRLQNMVMALQLHLHWRALRSGSQYQRKLRTTLVHARFFFIENYSAKKVCFTCNRRNQQHFQPTIRGSAMLPDAGNQF